LHGSNTQSTALPIFEAKVPDAPRSLTSNAIVTYGYQVGLSWIAGIMTMDNLSFDY